MLNDYNTKMKILSIIFLTVGLALITLCVLLFIQHHHFVVIEMQTQIEQFGFYKKDVIVLIDNNYKMGWSVGGALVSLFAGLLSFTGSAFCLGEWL